MCGLALGLALTGVALGQPGTPVTWGETAHCLDPEEPTFDQLYPPPNVSFKVVASGLRYNAGIDVDGVIHVWGGNPYLSYLSQIPPGTFSQIGCGEDFWVALRAPDDALPGRVEQRGWEEYNNFDDIPGSNYIFKQITVGEYHAIGLIGSSPANMEDKIHQWGGYEHPEDFPHTGNVPSFFNVGGTIPNTTFKSVTAGAYSSGGIVKSSNPDLDGRLIMWGDDNPNEGQLVSRAPRTGKFKFLAIGHRHAIAIRDGTLNGVDVDGKLEAWGYPDLGNVENVPAGKFKMAMGGYFHSSALTIYNEVVSWGAGSANLYCARPAPPGNNYVFIGPGQSSHHTVALTQGVSCYANCDGSTAPPVLNGNDWMCFLNRYSAGDSYANCDASTSPPVLNANDFQCFLNLYAVGCGS